MQGLGIRGIGVARRFGAALDLNFLTGFDPRISFSRPSTATRVNSAGLLETVASGAPRIDYDPVTLAVRGLLIEEQRTNLLLRSAELDVSPWVASAASISPNAGAAPDGAAGADKLVESMATSTHFVSQAVSVSLGAAYTASVYVKPAGRSAIRIRATTSTDSFIGDFDAGAGAVSGTSVVGGGTVAGATITPAGGGWYRCALTGQFAAGVSPQVDVWLRNAAGTSFPSYAGDGASGVLLWGAQFEAGAFASSYIPTSAAQATRAADVATLTLGSWFNPAEGAVVADVNLRTLGKSARVFAVDDGTVANMMDLTLGPANGVALETLVSSVYAASNNAGPAALGLNKLAARYKNDGTTENVAINGSVNAGASIAIPSGLTTLRLGHQATGAYLNDCLARLRVYRACPTTAQLQGLTA